MAQYRLYTIEENGHIAGPPATCDLDDDLSALAEARRRMDGRDMEIWQGRRLVAYLVADEERRSA